MKKIITMIMVMAMIIGTFALNAGAVCLTEDGRPDIIGVEHLKAVLKLEEDGFEPDYEITMVHVEGYWCVQLEGYTDEYDDYNAYGIYDHMPTEEEINILWANRMPWDELSDLFDQYTISE